MNPFKLIKYQLYLLQLENYEIGRYWSLLLKKGYFGIKEPLRKSLVWTAKAKIIFLLSLIIWLGLSAFILNTNIIYGIIALIILFLTFPAIYSLALILLLPIDYFSKIYLVNKAKKIISKSKDLKIVGIAGSYGKTTMKTVLSSVLSEQFDVLATPESVNTPVGIANWLIKNFKNNTEVLIIEMGEHYRGDIKYLCNFTKPDIAVVTGINEAHLERLHSLENATATIFEVVENAKDDALILLNNDDKRVKESYQKFTKGKKVEFYGSDRVSNKNFDQEKLAWNFSLPEIDDVSVRILGEYIIGDVVAASIAGNFLGINKERIKAGLNKIEPVEHRLQPIKGESNVLVIDDSYNGNPDGVDEAIKVMGRFSDRRKVFITPGLVESGDETKSIHLEIGKKLAGVANKVILIKNSVTGFIAEGLKQGGFDDKNIIWFATAEEAHKSLGTILQSNDIIVFQNDWGDQYL